MLSLVLCIMILIGLFLLSLVLRYPYKKLFSKKPNSKISILFHLLGWSLLMISLYLAIVIYGLGIGIVYWFGYVTFMALGLVGLFTSVKNSLLSAPLFRIG